MKKIIPLIIVLGVVFISSAQTQTQNLNMGLHQLQFPSASGGSNRIQSFGGTHPGKWHFKSRFDDIYIDAGENVNNRYKILFLTGGVERARIIGGNGNFGIGTTSPKAKLDVGTFLSEGQLGTVMARLQEGNTSGNGTYLGVKAYKTQGNISSGVKSFALEHSFYGVTNSSINFYRGGAVKGGYITFNTSDNIQQMCIRGNGNVGIGTENPDAKLTVKGNIHTQEVKVDLNGAVAPDYVFKEDYRLKSLDQVQAYINKNGHLPNIPSAAEMEKEGVLLKEMNLKLLEKIEELTLYTLEQEKELKTQALDNIELNKRVNKLETLILEFIKK